MANDSAGTGGFWSAIGRFLAGCVRFITFGLVRLGRRVDEAADRQFTGSVDGVKDAFEIHRDKLIAQYNGYRDAVAQVEVVAEEKRQQLARLNEREEQLLKLRDGALARAENEKNPDEMAKHQAAYARYQEEIATIEAKQAQLEKEIADLNDSMKKHMLGLSKLQAEVQKLPQEKAQAIADFISAKKIIELNDRLAGLQSSIDRGPIDVVLQHNRELTAKARISDKLAGTDVALQDQDYEKAGTEAKAADEFQRILAARRAEKEAKNASTDAPAPVKDERPKF